MRPGGWNIQRIRSAQIYWISRNTAETQLCSTKKEPRTKKPHIWHTPSWCWTNQMCERNTLKQQSPDKELNTCFVGLPFDAFAHLILIISLRSAWCMCVCAQMGCAFICTSPGKVHMHMMQNHQPPPKTTNTLRACTDALQHSFWGICYVGILFVWCVFGQLAVCLVGVLYYGYTCALRRRCRKLFSL